MLLRTLKLFFALFALLAPQLAGANEVFVKLNFLDCIACTSSLERISAKVPGLSIVLPEDYMPDSTAVSEKFGLGRYRLKLIWSDSLYARLGSEMFSEVIIMRRGAMIWRSNLKNLDIDSFQHYLGYGGCPYELPRKFSVSGFGRGLMLNDYVNEKRYLLDPGHEKRSIEVPDTVVRHAYLHFLKDTAGYEDYSLQMKKDTKLRPSITAVMPVDDSTQKVIYRFFRLEEVSGEDSIYGKIIACVDLRNNRVTGIRLIDLSTIPRETGYNEYNLFTHKGELYFSPLMKLTGTAQDMATRRVLAKLKLKDDWYVLDTVYGFSLPDRLISSKVGYNFFAFKYTAGYLTFPLSDYAIDLNTMSRIRLPFADSILNRNAGVMSDFKLRYYLDDFKYNKANGTFTVLYRIDETVYWGRFSAKAEMVSLGHVAFPAGERDRLQSYCLAEEGRKIVYALKTGTCLLEKAIP